MLKRFLLWWKGYRSGLCYIGRVKRLNSNGLYEIKLVNNDMILAELVNNLSPGDYIVEDMIVTVNYQAGKWLFHIPVWA